MTTHESKHRATNNRSRVAPSVSLARKTNGTGSSSAELQRRRLGNHGSQQFLTDLGHNTSPTHSPVIQAKLSISQPGDAHEREADRVADAVMRMPDANSEKVSTASTSSSQVQRQCVECDEDQKKKGNAIASVSRKAATTAATPVPPPVAANVQALRGGGSALPSATRAFFEPRLGADLGSVRVHTDARAEQTAASISAQAFTVGSDIAFAKGRYAPNSNTGQKLLAHELVHVVQQRNGVVSPSLIHRSPDEPAGGCGLCYGDRLRGGGGARNAGIAVHKAIQDQLAPKGGVIEAELPWGDGRVDLAIVRPVSKEVAIAEIKPANEKGIDDGVKQIEQRLRAMPKLKAYAGYKWVKLDKPVGKQLRFPTDAPFCTPPYTAQPGYCFSQGLSVAGPVNGLLYLYFCEPSYSELLALGCDCKCKEPKDKKPKDQKPKDKDPSPSQSPLEQLAELGKELLPWLARARLLDIGLALARGMLAFISAPLAALAAVIIGIVMFWDELKWLGGKIASIAKAAWDRISALAGWVRDTFASILGKLRDLGVKIYELGRFVAGKVIALAKKIAAGVSWLAGRIASGAKWLGRKIASGAEAFWDWVWGSDVEPIYPIIDIPIEREKHCRTVAMDDTIIQLPADLLFPFGEWALKEEAFPLLDAAGKKITAMLHKDDWIRFEGYTDVIGDKGKNKTLSVKRAETIRSWFVAKGIVPWEKTRIEGYGETEAKAKAGDEEGRKKDRRVDIWLPKRGGTRTECW